MKTPPSWCFTNLAPFCHAQYNFDEAKSWYQQALSLSDRLGNQAQMATELHFLGLLEQDRGIVYEEAEEWYLAALERREELGDRRGGRRRVPSTGCAVPRTEEIRRGGKLVPPGPGRFSRNWARYRESPELTVSLGMVCRGTGQPGRRSGMDGAHLSTCLPSTSCRYWYRSKAHLARLREKYGEADFARWWVDFTGDEAPSDLEVDASGIL